MKQNFYRGKFIVFEGLNGSGKSEQARLLKEYLDRRGQPALLTKEPTEWTQAGKIIKDALEKKNGISPLRLQELFAEDRAEHLREKVIPALRQGQIVISDRYAFSSLAFGGLDVPTRMLLRLNRDFICPDTIFLLRVKPEESWRRVGKRRTKLRIFEELEKMRRVAANYEALAGSPRFRESFTVLDGEKSIDGVHREVVLSLSSFLK